MITSDTLAINLLYTFQDLLKSSTGCMVGRGFQLHVGSASYAYHFTTLCGPVTSSIQKSIPPQERSAPPTIQVTTLLFLLRLRFMPAPSPSSLLPSSFSSTVAKAFLQLLSLWNSVQPYLSKQLPSITPSLIHSSPSNSLLRHVVPRSLLVLMMLAKKLHSAASYWSILESCAPAQASPCAARRRMMPEL